MMAEKPKVKLYRKSNGGIGFNSERKPGEVRIPNYVYDIWMPILGIEVIGVYAVYCRLERENQVTGLTQPQIATSCKIGTRRLDAINDLLQEHGFIKVHRPDNKQKSKHEKTIITVKDPPTFVKSEFIDKHNADRKVKYVPLTAWLVEDSTALSTDYAPRSQMEMRSPESALSNGNAGALSTDYATIVTLKDIATLELQPVVVAETRAEKSHDENSVVYPTATTEPLRVVNHQKPDIEPVKEKLPIAAGAEPTPPHSGRSPLPAHIRNFKANNEQSGYHPFIEAWRAAYPKAPPSPAPDDTELAKQLERDGYLAEQITALTKEKLAAGKTMVKFLWIAQDISDYVLRQSKPKPADSTPAKVWKPTAEDMKEFYAVNGKASGDDTNGNPK